MTTCTPAQQLVRTRYLAKSRGMFITERSLGGDHMQYNLFRDTGAKPVYLGHVNNIEALARLVKKCATVDGELPDFSAAARANAESFGPADSIAQAEQITAAVAALVPQRGRIDFDMLLAIFFLLAAVGMLGWLFGTQIFG